MNGKKRLFGAPWRCLLAACAAVLGCEEPPGADLEAVGVASAASRWAPVSPPTDLSLLEAPATVLSTPDAVGQVTPTFRARVSKLHVMPGTRVEVGDAIAGVVAPELLVAAATYRTSGVRLAAFRDRREQLAALEEEGLVERGRVFEVSTQLAQVEAERAAALAELRSAGIDPGDLGRLLRRGELTLRSPVAGIVRGVHAVVGEVWEPSSEPLAVVVGEGTPRVEARFSSSLPRGVRFELRTAGGGRYTLSPTPLSSVVEPEDGTTLAWFSLADAEIRLPPGLVGRVRATAEADVLQVPGGAIRSADGAAEVLARGPGDDSPRRVSVEVLAMSGAVALVRGELRVDDRVAADVQSVLGGREGGGH